jgi:endonuclease-8
MPEGDTVRRACAALERHLKGAPLNVAELRWPTLAGTDLRGRSVREVAAYGKHLLIRLDNDWTLHTHLRMDGRWVFARPAAAKARFLPQARVVLGTADWVAVGLSLGMLDLVRTRDEASLIGHLGPDILADDFDEAEALARLRGFSGTIGAALLDQTNLAGIGTFWAAEALFVRRLDPWRPANELSVEQLTALVEWTRRTMLANLNTPVQNSTGVTVPGRTSYVHGRLRQTCRRCGTPIAVASVGPPTRERPMFHCPACQRVAAP